MADFGKRMTLWEMEHSIKLEHDIKGEVCSFKKVAGNTCKYSIGRKMFLRLHHTDIVIWDHESATTTITSGGWRSHTTKGRINTFSYFSIFQKKFEWFICFDHKWEKAVPFEDGMKFDLNTGELK